MAASYDFTDFNNFLSEISSEIKQKDTDGSIETSILKLQTDCHGSWTEKAQKFLSWSRKQQKLKVIEAVVPYGILPTGISVTLYDIKVSPKHGPDDAIYDSSEEIRKKVARGNCLLEITNGKKNEITCITYALKKFTGGLGDDDDKDRGDNHTWKKYFTKPLTEAIKVVCTQKANGEAAHLSAIKIAGQIYICGGSKNVHMLFRNKDDMEKYTEPRYRIALDVCKAILNLLDSMDEVKRARLLEFLCATRLTGVFEILCPDHQHVEDLSYLERSELKFIAWTSNDLDPPEQQQLCHMAPHVAIEIASALGFSTIDYTVIPVDEVENRMKEIRRGYNYEGQVLYFIDSEQNVIGLLKKKTIWYILCRAIREKVKHACSDYKKNEHTYSTTKSIKKIAHRLREIKSWLGIDDKSLEAWTTLGSEFLQWCINNVGTGNISMNDVADLYPVTWKKFLQETGKSDKIDVQWKEPPGSDD